MPIIEIVSGGTDLPEITATASDIRSGKKSVNQDGEQITGTIEDYTGDVEDILYHFEIDFETLTAVPLMDWAEWIMSSYNTSTRGLFVNSDSNIEDGEANKLFRGSDLVEASDLILDGETYNLM